MVKVRRRNPPIDSCPQAAWIPYQEPVRRHLQIPDDEELVTGMSLGHADPDVLDALTQATPKGGLLVLSTFRPEHVPAWGAACSASRVETSVWTARR